MFQHYQTVLAKIVKNLFPKELKQAKLTAKMWNWKDALEDAKARYMFCGFESKALKSINHAL